MIRPRVLFVSKAFPADLTESVHGIYRRMTIFIDALKQIASLEFIFYVPADIDVSEPARRAAELALSGHWDAPLTLSLCRRGPPAPPSRWQAYAAGAFSVHRQQGHHDVSGPRQVAALAGALARRPDLLFVHRLHSMSPVLRAARPLPPTYLDLDDVEHRRFMREIRQPPDWPGKRLLYLQLPALLLGERRAIRLTQRTFVCSERDRDDLRRLLRLPNIDAVPNATAVPRVPLPVMREPTLLFLGSYSYQPNMNAAEFLVREVWPVIRAAVPSARLTIAGPQSDLLPAHIRDEPGVECPGFVEDLASLYARSRIVCAPILSGGGTRVKIIEAAAHGRAVVATRLGAEGLRFADGRELLLRDDAPAFAAACTDLLLSDELCARLGSAAHAAAARFYDRGAVVQSLVTQLEADRRAARRAPTARLA